ncbi:TetR/AcrR family transcriptional regulator [Ectobacillus polymachus]|uniref:TetR/AcrR family transcriptional regulator n=1 Tax=Ectobacillus polymachus TaxID=1508806 RepID=UPI003A885463
MSENILDKIISQTKLSKKTTDKQKKIEETAIKMFAEKGYANTSTSEIAKASGVAEGTIFRHYGTKDNLLLSVLLPFIKELMPALMQEVIDEFSPKKFDSFEMFLRELLKNRMKFIKENREIFKILVKELLYRDDLRKEFLSFVNKDIFLFIGNVVDTFKEQGELKKLPTLTIMRMLGTFIGGYFTSRFIFLPDDYIAEDDVEIEYMVGFIMNGLKA